MLQKSQKIRPFLGNVHLLSEGGGSKMGGLRKIDEVRAGVYENYLTPIGGSTKKKSDNQ